MKKEQRKVVENKLKQIWKIYTSAPWGKTKKFVLEDDLIKATGSIEYSHWFSDTPDWDIKDINVKLKAKSAYVNSDDIEDKLIRQIEDEPYASGVIYDFRVDYDNIWNIWASISDVIALDVEEWDLSELISENTTQTEFVERVMELLLEELDEMENMRIVRLNDTYSAKIFTDGRVKVGCQTIPITAIERVVEEYKNLKNQ